MSGGRPCSLKFGFYHSATVLLTVCVLAGSALSASDHYGQVTFTGLPVPGATVTATQGEKTILAVSDASGVYKLSGLADGAWSVRVEMLGFEPLTQEITIAPDAPPATFAL